jgi:hypothetical protein
MPARLNDIETMTPADDPANVTRRDVLLTNVHILRTLTARGRRPEVTV